MPPHRDRLGGGAASPSPPGSTWGPLKDSWGPVLGALAWWLLWPVWRPPEALADLDLLLRPPPLSTRFKVRMSLMEQPLIQLQMSVSSLKLVSMSLFSSVKRFSEFL